MVAGGLESLVVASAEEAEGIVSAVTCKLVGLLVLLGAALSWPAVAADGVVPAPSVSAGPVDPLVALLSPRLAPQERARLVGAVCGGSEPIDPSALAALLSATTVGRLPPIDGARIAACRAAPELAGVMFARFFSSFIGTSESDPDLFERLLRGLQRLPPEVARDALLAADPVPMVALARDRLVGDWLLPISGGSERGTIGVVDPQTEAEAEGAVRAWIAALLVRPVEGLQRLQVDSGGAAVRLQAHVQSVLLEGMRRRGSPRDRELAEEAGRQMGLPAPGARIEPFAPETRVYPVVPLVPGVPSGDYYVSASAPSRLKGRLPWVLVLALLGGMWIGALRLRPAWRPMLFRAGAVLAPFMALFLLDGALLAAGVRPRIEIEPAFDPNRRGADLFGVEELGGARYHVAQPGGHRAGVVPVLRAPGSLRVVVLGESAVHGTHYLVEEAFPAVLERSLAALHPQGPVEVINLGVGGALSDLILAAAVESWSELDPDLLVLYFGYNDLTHLPVMARYRGFSAARIALRRGLDRSPTVRLWTELMPRGLLDRAADAGPDGATLDEGEQGAAERAWLRRVASAGASDVMERIVRQGRAEAVPTLIVVQGTRQDSCGDADARGLSRDAKIEAGCHRDELRRIAARAASAAGAPLFDAAGLLRAAASERPGSEGVDMGLMFWDGVHPTRAGHAVLGEALAPAVLRTLAENAAPP